jgi:hypothetical protein
VIRINKTKLAIAAIAFLGLGAAIDLAQSRQPDVAPISMSQGATAVALRFPQTNEMMVAKLIMPAQSKVVFTPKADPQSDKVFVPTQECVHEHWPYIADECLVARDGGKVHRPARKIITERPVRPIPGPASASARMIASR